MSVIHTLPHYVHMRSQMMDLYPLHTVSTGGTECATTVYTCTLCTQIATFQLNTVAFTVRTCILVCTCILVLNISIRYTALSSKGRPYIDSEQANKDLFAVSEG